MKFVGTILDDYKGIGPGFDFLRLWLAGSVIWFHAFVVTGQMNFLEQTPAWFYVNALVPMFFALSGFLVAGSAQRLNPPNFLINRGLRIIPALAVEIGVSALVLGPLLTTLPIWEYFTRPQFWHYFTNIFGWIQFQLPGVFERNPSAGMVNLSLWTVPFELGCYGLISIMIVLKLTQRPLYILGFAILLLLVPAVSQMSGMAEHGGGQKVPALIRYAFFSRGAVLFPSFLFGACFYYFREHVPYSRIAAILITLSFVVIACVGRESWKDSYVLNVFTVPGFTYLIIFLGLTPFPKIPFFSRGDYSYGIYLYGYPIQQALILLMPGLTFWLPFFLVSLTVATAMAAFSWHVVEKPILTMRRKFSFVAQVRGVDTSDERVSPKSAAANARSVKLSD